jgi:hypothetical protein
VKAGTSPQLRRKGIYFFEQLKINNFFAVKKNISDVDPQKKNFVAPKKPQQLYYGYIISYSNHDTVYSLSLWACAPSN